MQKPNNMPLKNSGDDYRDTIWRVKKHASEILDHYDSLQIIINNRIREHFGSDQARIRESYDALRIAQTVQSVREIAFSIVNLPDLSSMRVNTTFDATATQWMAELAELRTRLSSFPTKSQLSTTLEKIVSRHARLHITSMRKLMPDVIDNIGRLKSNHIPSEHNPTSGSHKYPLPSQVNAPIMTKIEDDTLVTAPGKSIETSDSATELTKYLLKQVREITSQLSNLNIHKRDTAIFAETIEILGDWSTSKILSFGAHLYLLDLVAASLSDEIDRPISNRISSFLTKSREFVNSFEEWRDYTDQSVAFAVEEHDLAKVRQELGEVSIALSSEGGSVEPRIPKAIDQYTKLAGENDKKKRTIGVMSALASVKNLTISLVQYAIDAAKAGSSVLSNSRAVKLLRVICRVHPRLTTIAHTLPILSFLLAHANEIKAACDL